MLRPAPAEALSTQLCDGKSQTGKEKPAHGSVASQTKRAVVEHKDEKPQATPDEIWADLMDGHRRFVAGRPQTRPLVAAREHLANGQHPQVIVLGCADSRVTPEPVFDKNLGELLVVRRAAHIADPITLGRIEYAAEHLHASLLVVLGDERCGAVAAAASGEKTPTPSFDAIVKKIYPKIGNYMICVEGDQLVGLAVQANVK